MITLDYVNKHGLEYVQEKYKIKVSQNELYPDLYCLNYDQIESIKLSPVVKECRSLVIRKEDDGEFVVSSRSFDRFFNYGETEEEYNITELTAYEKIDGSLLNIWYDNKYGWLYRTRSMIMPADDMSINGGDVTWKDLIERNIRDFHALDPTLTYICEIVSKHNRVVTRYDEERIYLLASRCSKTGGYVKTSPRQFHKPKSFKFDTIKGCLEAVRSLPNLEEGYVLYNSFGVPQVKVKNPSYVAAHRLRGDCTPTPKRIMDMILENETDEYLSIFPEDLDMFEPYINALEKGVDIVLDVWESVKNIPDQKAFADNVKQFHFASILFSMRNRNESFNDAFYRMTRQGQYRFIEGFIEDNS